MAAPETADLAVLTACVPIEAYGYLELDGDRVVHLPGDIDVLAVGRNEDVRRPVQAVDSRRAVDIGGDEGERAGRAIEAEHRE